MDISYIPEITRALRSMDEPPMAYGYDGMYRWKTAQIGRDAANMIDRLVAENQRLKNLPKVILCRDCIYWQSLPSSGDMACTGAFAYAGTPPDFYCGGAKQKDIGSIEEGTLSAAKMLTED